MNFGQALEIIKHGGKAERAGWNGKGMWICLGEGHAALASAHFWNEHTKAFAEANGGCATVLPYIIMKTAGGEILMGWLASQSDMLAEDWRPTEDNAAVKVIDPTPLVTAPTSDQAIENEIQVKGKTAPRITLDDVIANIDHIETVKHVTQSGQVLRWAVLVTKSGFAAVGKPSVAVSPENDDAETGEQVAFENSRDELWPLMGYLLKQQLHEKACEYALLHGVVERQPV